MILGFEWISEKIEMIFLLYGICCASTRTYIVSQMSISIGQMNSLLKEYTDALLTLHGIPLTDYSHKVSGEAMVAEFTARKTLATAMWQLHEQAQAQADEINHLTEKNEQLEQTSSPNSTAHPTITLRPSVSPPPSKTSATTSPTAVATPTNALNDTRPSSKRLMRR